VYSVKLNLSVAVRGAALRAVKIINVIGNEYRGSSGMLVSGRPCRRELKLTLASGIRGGLAGEIMRNSDVKPREPKL